MYIWKDDAKEQYVEAMMWDGSEFCAGLLCAWLGNSGFQWILSGRNLIIVGFISLEVGEWAVYYPNEPNQMLVKMYSNEFVRSFRRAIPVPRESR
jgi:hypothetical protein